MILTYKNIITGEATEVNVPNFPTTAKFIAVNFSRVIELENLDKFLANQKADVTKIYSHLVKVGENTYMELSSFDEIGYKNLALDRDIKLAGITINKDTFMNFSSHIITAIK